MIEINGVQFEPHPEIGILPYNPKLVNYRTDYEKIVLDIKNKRYGRLLFNKEVGVDEFSAEEEDQMRWLGAEEKKNPGYLEACVFRKLIATDLWFLLYFIVKPFLDENGRRKVNHPFVVQACNELQKGPKDNTLDLWAREHYKSSILTIAETIQYQLKNPECSTGILSYVAPKSKKFLFSIRSIFESQKILYTTYPDVVWENPKSEAPLWSIDEGIILRRRSTRQEPSIGAYGLTEGMPTGFHFERRIYDDIVTEDIGESVDVMETIKKKFDSSQNLGKEGGHHRVIGTYYHHSDPLTYIRDKVDPKSDPERPKPLYYIRFKPATDDGTREGKPVLISQERLDFLKTTATFNCQQLLNPTPEEEQKLNPDYFQPIGPEFIPREVIKFLLVDQAGDAGSNKTKVSDAWAAGVLGVEPVADEIGQSRVFLMDLWISIAGESEAIDQIVRMYVDGGVIARLGVEKVGISTTHLHIAKALKAKGRFVEFDEADNGVSSGVLLRPAGRHKKKFIEGALAWPLNNGKLYYSTRIKPKYIERLKQEMANHPRWNDDGLNMMAYLYDVIKEYRFSKPETEFERMQARMNQQRQDYNPLTFSHGRA